MGFLGVKNSPEGNLFVDWWAHRCLNFCDFDSTKGLFTDQRWIDLVPSYFNDFAILKHPGYNVANWNLSHRQVTCTPDNEILVNDQLLCFFHFSNSQSIMADKHDIYNDITRSLFQEYQQQCEQMGQNELATVPCIYSFYDNQELITPQQRRLYRDVVELQEQFPHPFNTSSQRSYYQWYQEYEQDKKQKERQLRDLQDQVQNLETKLEYSQRENQAQEKLFTKIEQELVQAQATISGMKSSKFWKIRKQWFKIKKTFGISGE